MIWRKGRQTMENKKCRKRYRLATALCAGVLMLGMVNLAGCQE